MAQISHEEIILRGTEKHNQLLAKEEKIEQALAVQRQRKNYYG